VIYGNDGQIYELAKNITLQNDVKKAKFKHLPDLTAYTSF